MPRWLVRPIAASGRSGEVRTVLHELSLHTVCQGAKCPNQGECFADGTATFLIMGPACTRHCAFCAVEAGRPEPLDPDEPRRVAEAAARMGLTHVVVTSVTRDDLDDGGSDHFARTVDEVRRRVPEATAEVLTSDFGGSLEAVDRVLDAGPDVLNHNVETVPRLYPSIRPEADYERSLSVLRHAAGHRGGALVKSGVMLGLGETAEEVVDVVRDLAGAGCSLLTLGQYLRPSRAHAEVAAFVEPEVFERLEAEARSVGFREVASAPYVRSSYRAGDMTRATRDR
jgi:lipoic acid synthetase